MNICLNCFFVHENLGVLKRENAAFLEMPYQGENQAISMIVFLPLKNSATAVDKLLTKFTTETINKAMTQGKLEMVDVEFPKLSLKGDYLLSGVSFCKEFLVENPYFLM